MDETIDLLQIRIEKAKSSLPKETQMAIDAVDWKDVILGMKSKKGYNLEQLEDLELETELLLCGITNPNDYPKELETRLKIPRAQVDELINELNELIFKKIREELIKITEKNKMLETVPVKTREEEIFNPKEAIKKDETQTLNSAGIEITEPSIIPTINKEASMETRDDMLQKVERPELITKELEVEKKEIPPATPFSKLSGSFVMPTVKTEYSLGNISKTTVKPTQPTTSNTVPRVDPYRMSPDE